MAEESKTAKILIVEDEAEIRRLIVLYMLNAGFQAVTAEDGKQALELLERERPDLIVLDILLPDIDGLELCGIVRRSWDIPVIFVSCKRESEDVISGLEAEADDYVTKPFDPAVLVARVKANLRRASRRDKNDDGGEWKDERLYVNLLSFEVLIHGQPVPLLPKERQLLLLLLKHPNQVFSVEQMYERIWGWESVSDERTVMVHISNLRKKIEADPASPKYIHTVRGFGYKFQGEG
ncbi:response regulator transcription factor [Paenibacillus contaminans]|uniref:DNA-binding response regulator n=1 Tax=Paenibacillus contaminans TaxID=450362 RepID=A0A329M9R1_9BACL|nr:response regulator transcription factor [Paenibacillus contaminans]RAV16721.1 DNA-binding response regulator [Paenibacillus contaminans]